MIWGIRIGLSFFTVRFTIGPILILLIASKGRVTAAASVKASLACIATPIRAAHDGACSWTLLIIRGVRIGLTCCTPRFTIGPKFILLEASKALVVATASVKAPLACIATPTGVAQDLARPRALFMIRGIRIALSWHTPRFTISPTVVLLEASKAW